MLTKLTILYHTKRELLYSNPNNVSLHLKSLKSVKRSGIIMCSVSSTAGLLISIKDFILILLIGRLTYLFCRALERWFKGLNNKKNNV